ncbi:MAG: peptidase M23 [Leptospiraceae bacterium]|nr:MAG: peptidase M23 [Leptospiraceae bacterium]
MNKKQNKKIKNRNSKHQDSELQKKKLQEEEAKIYSKYLEIDFNKNQQNKWQKFKENVILYLKKIHTKGKQKITIMFIPHSESSILNLHINFYTLFFSLTGIFIVGLISILIIIQRSSQNIQYYDMGITNSQFYLQSSRLAEEVIPMHKAILEFASTIATIHQKLRINSEQGEGGFAYNTTFDQIEKLKALINECKLQKEACSQDTIENILQITLNISLLDNDILKSTNQQIVEINEKLKSEETKNFFSYIPTGLPVQGFIRNNYATRSIIERGNNYPLRGIEFLTLPHSPVYATANGKVVEINYHPVFGVYVWIEHLTGIKSFYAHLDEVQVSLNQIVKKGDIIGFSGKTGKTDKNLLYYEIHIGTVAFNPHILLNDLQTLWLNLQKQ